MQIRNMAPSLEPRSTKDGLQENVSEPITRICDLHYALSQSNASPSPFAKN